MTLQELLLILRARAKVVVITLLATLLSTLALSVLLPKQYTATTAVVIDVKSPDPIAGMILPGMISPGYMATQVDIITSDRVAQRAAKLLHMDEDASMKALWRDATEGRGKFEAWLGNLLQKKLDVKPSRESNVINIAYTGSDPARTAAVANAFARAYIDVNLELKIDPARQSATWFEEQTRSVRDKLEAAQQVLSSYQQKTGIMITDDRVDYETAKLNELSSQLTLVQTQTSDSHSKSATAGGSETLPEVMQSTLINGLRADIARLEARQQESSVNLGMNHPQTLRTSSELTSLKDRLAEETRRISSSLGTLYRVGKQKEKELLDAIQAQKTRVLDLNKHRDELSVLTRDVVSAQRAFDGVSQRSTQARLESLSIQTNITPLNHASEPTTPSRPNLVLNMLIALFLGSLLGVGLALMIELVQRRVRSSANLAEAIDLPILVCISSTAAAPSLTSAVRNFLFLPKAEPAGGRPRGNLLSLH
jgi:chain length determinant protein EpsF